MIIAHMARRDNEWLAGDMPDPPAQPMGFDATLDRQREELAAARAETIRRAVYCGRLVGMSAVEIADWRSVSISDVQVPELDTAPLAYADRIQAHRIAADTLLGAWDGVRGMGTPAQAGAVKAMLEPLGLVAPQADTVSKALDVAAMSAALVDRVLGLGRKYGAVTGPEDNPVLVLPPVSTDPAR